MRRLLQEWVTANVGLLSRTAYALKNTCHVAVEQRTTPSMLKDGYRIRDVLTDRRYVAMLGLAARELTSCPDRKLRETHEARGSASPKT
jgi:hypothetical protein